ncbi:BolA-like protein [Encephalitozoon romaleae SJ-2008]|uniref:BolA-like protein n=1 Tax=Encephalitozoon romaleae (strain SJ-2008) TaxID=1178016 RepID=I6ZL19_ENCRO|nr:BolA-like protein [Encephalitozoon romaleae SJ-2008]AFN84018.1 BolA-like protein [Encephalitozoon romaleae SJ-2008]
MKGGLEAKMFNALKNEFCPTRLEVKNTSCDHTGHRIIEQEEGLETHFHVRVRSAMFNGMKFTDRHRLVYKTLEFAFSLGLHAIEIDCDSDSQE